MNGIAVLNLLFLKHQGPWTWQYEGWTNTPDTYNRVPGPRWIVVDASSRRQVDHPSKLHDQGQAEFVENHFTGNGATATAFLTCLIARYFGNLQVTNIPTLPYGRKQRRHSDKKGSCLPMWHWKRKKVHVFAVNGKVVRVLPCSFLITVHIIRERDGMRTHSTNLTVIIHFAAWKEGPILDFLGLTKPSTIVGSR